MFVFLSFFTSAWKIIFCLWFLSLCPFTRTSSSCCKFISRVFENWFGFWFRYSSKLMRNLSILRIVFRHITRSVCFIKKTNVWCYRLNGFLDIGRRVENKICDRFLCGAFSVVLISRRLSSKFKSSFRKIAALCDDLAIEISGNLLHQWIKFQSRHLRGWRDRKSRVVF